MLQTLINRLITQTTTTDNVWVSLQILLIGCGPNCQQCKDDLGWIDCLSSTDSSKSFYPVTTSGVSSCNSCSSTLDSCILCSDSSTCTVRDSKVLATGVACDDSNCRVWTSDKSVWNYWKSGYILSGSSCLGILILILFS